MCKKGSFSYPNFQKSPYRGRGKPPASHTLYFIIYVVMAFNVTENAVFITKFSKSPYRGRGKPPPTPSPRFSSPPPPIETPWLRQWMHSFKSHHDTEFGAQSMVAIRRFGGGGGGRTGKKEKPQFFQLPKIASPVLQKLNHTCGVPI